jgi:hypothetical protein
VVFRVLHYGSLSTQFDGKAIMNISTSPVPDRPQLVVNSTRVMSELTVA